MAGRAVIDEGSSSWVDGHRERDGIPEYSGRP